MSTILTLKLSKVTVKLLSVRYVIVVSAVVIALVRWLVLDSVAVMF